jgi:hypothetical protein
VRWEETAFGFSGLTFVSAKNKCAVCAVGLFCMKHNGSQLGEVAEIEAQMFSFARKFNRRTVVEFSTEPAILPNCCYAQCLFARSMQIVQFAHFLLVSFHL